MCGRCTCRRAAQGLFWHHRAQYPGSWAAQGGKAYRKTNKVIVAFLCQSLMLALYADFQS